MRSPLGTPASEREMSPLDEVGEHARSAPEDPNGPGVYPYDVNRNADYNPGALSVADTRSQRRGRQGGRGP